MSLAKFSVENGVLINMIMIIVFIFGIMTLISMPKEEAPAVDFGAFYIMVGYRGVSPDCDGRSVERLQSASLVLIVLRLLADGDRNSD